MARAYKKTYLNGAMRNLAVMMDCGVRKYGYSIEEFYQKFLASKVARQFAAGNPRYLVGMSGAELADTVVESTGGTVLKENDGTYSVGPAPIPLAPNIGPVGRWHTTIGSRVAVLPICTAKDWVLTKLWLCIILFMRLTFPSSLRLLMI